MRRGKDPKDLDWLNIKMYHPADSSIFAMYHRRIAILSHFQWCLSKCRHHSYWLHCQTHSLCDWSCAHCLLPAHEISCATRHLCHKHMINCFLCSFMLSATAMQTKIVTQILTFSFFKTSSHIPWFTPHITGAVFAAVYQLYSHFCSVILACCYHPVTSVWSV